MQISKLFDVMYSDLIVRMIVFLLILYLIKHRVGMSL